MQVYYYYNVSVSMALYSSIIIDDISVQRYTKDELWMKIMVRSRFPTSRTPIIFQKNRPDL